MIKLNDNTYTEAPKPSDAKYGPYLSLAEARTAVPVAYRHIGLTIGLVDGAGSVTDYWWKMGTADDKLVIKLGSDKFSSISPTGEVKYSSNLQTLVEQSDSGSYFNMYDNFPNAQLVIMKSVVINTNGFYIAGITDRYNSGTTVGTNNKIVITGGGKVGMYGIWLAETSMVLDVEVDMRVKGTLSMVYLYFKGKELRVNKLITLVQSGNIQPDGTSTSYYLGGATVADATVTDVKFASIPSNFKGNVYLSGYFVGGSDYGLIHFANSANCTGTVHCVNVYMENTTLATPASYAAASCVTWYGDYASGNLILYGTNVFKCQNNEFVNMFSKSHVVDVRGDVFYKTGTRNVSFNQTVGKSLIKAYVDARVGEGLTSAQVQTQINNTAVLKEAGKGLSTNDFTNAYKTKVDGLESSKFKGLHTSFVALQTAVPTGEAGAFADVDSGAGAKVVRYIWDAQEGWIAQLGESNSETAVSVATKYESNFDVNRFTNAYKGKLDGVEANATNWTNAKTIASTLTGFVTRVADAVLSDTSTIREALEILHWRTQNIDAVRVVSGTIADARLSNNIPKLNAANAFTQPLSVIRVAAATALSYAAGSDVIARYLENVDGKHEWGDGTSARDTFLERLSAALLRLTGSLDITGTLYALGLSNRASTNNAKIDLNNTGTEVKTSIAGNVVAKFINTITNATGDLIQAIKGSSVLFKVDANGGVDATNYTKAGVKKWVDQTYINDAFVNVVNDVPPTEMTKLTTTNWTNGVYTGEPIINTTVGMSFVSGTYRYVCDEDNVWSRLTRA